MKKIFLLVLVLIVLMYCVSCAAFQGEIEGIDASFSTDSHDDFDIENIPIDEQIGIQLSPQETKVSFLAAGDNIIYMGQIREAAAYAKYSDSDAEFDFKNQYRNVSNIIENYDIAFINQETLMAGEYFGYSAYPDFNSPRDLGRDLVSLGFDIVNIATNHMLDMQRSGLKSTIDFWKSQDVMMVGGYYDKEDFMNIRIIERNGIKIAAVGFTYDKRVAKYGADPVSDDKTPFVPFIYDEDIVSWIKKADDLADFVVVSIHWGKEYVQTPSDEQRRLAELISDSGGDVILGHHTHSLQPIEWVEGKNGNKTLCFYSLGNFISQSDEEVSMVGGIATFDIIKNERDGIYVDNIVFMPTVTDYRKSFKENTIYFLENYSDELCSTHYINRYFHKHIDMKMLCGFVFNVIDKKYLSESFLAIQN